MNRHSFQDLRVRILAASTTLFLSILLSYVILSQETCPTPTVSTNTAS